MTLTLERAMRYRRPLVVAAHVALFALSYVLSFALRFDFMLPQPEVRRLIATVPILIALRLTTFWVLHLYQGLWRYVSMRDLVDLVKAVTVSSAAFVTGVLIFGGAGFPRSIFILDWVLCLGLAGGLRVCTRLALERRGPPNSSNDSHPQRRPAIVVGAGDVAEALMREVSRGALPYRVVALVDDGPLMRGRRLRGVRVLGGLDDLARLCEQHGVRDVLLATPDISRADRGRILERCRHAGAYLKTVPSVSDLLHGRAGIGQLREVGMHELLGRDAVGTEVERLRDELTGRRILVTGAAGSIGSELARQIAAFAPELLVLFDRAESDLYLTLVELRERFPDVKIEAIVGDILDEARVRQVTVDFAPELVYHAAAFKHVPLMESNPLEAIKNNVFGTDVVVRAAIEAGSQKFVLISTDKAVRPVGVMGMTKRAAELLIQGRSGHGTTLVAVRFGNVLGSNGSVLPLFRRQIASGLPLTLTHPDASRYFMLTSEAAELVLQAGALGVDGEVYFLNMGEPMRIGDLANNLIRLSGLEPEVEVPIQVTGLRPGERLHEHLIPEHSDVRPGPHEKILVVREPAPDRRAFGAGLKLLHDLVESGARQAALEILSELVTAETHESTRTQNTSART